MRGRTVLLLAAAAGCAVTLAAPGLATRFVQSFSPRDVARVVVSWTKTALNEGRGSIRNPGDCRTALAKTTSCKGEDSSWQECHYHYRAEGMPDRRLCAAFIARPWTASTGARSQSARSSQGSSSEDLARSGVIPFERQLEGCLETSPLGWERIACERVHLDPTMACFRCDDGPLEGARSTVQAFDPSCARAIVLKSCNEPLP